MLSASQASEQSLIQNLMQGLTEDGDLPGKVGLVIAFGFHM